MSRLLVAIVLRSALACHPTPAPQRIDPNARPSSWLAPLPLGSEVAHWLVTIRGLRDTADRPLSEKTVAQIPVTSGSGEVLITSDWSPPTRSVDSLVVAPTGLRPVRELLAYNGFTRRYQYAGNHVWGTVQHGDSTPRVFDHVFSDPVFAFNENDLLVRAVAFRSGLSVVLPLFSESDESVERDTITVVAPTKVRRNDRDEDAWIIRFADPAIVSTYVVLAASRQILSLDTQQRRSGAVLHFRDDR
jgi:hypothetical protein